jgi:DNA-binding response OmpR family regulator
MSMPIIIPNQNKVILVVEDEKPLLQAIKSKLEKNNFNVVVARSVEQAERCVYELEHIDLIWLDHYLFGKENGLDFIKWLKKEDNEKYRQIPIFVVSNMESNEEISIYIKLGAKKYFVKSNYKLDEIISEINKTLSEKSSV